MKYNTLAEVLNRPILSHLVEAELLEQFATTNKLKFEVDDFLFIIIKNVCSFDLTVVDLY